MDDCHFNYITKIEKKNTNTQVPTYSNLHFGKGQVSYSIRIEAFIS